MAEENPEAQEGQEPTSEEIEELRERAERISAQIDAAEAAEEGMSMYEIDADAVINELGVEVANLKIELAKKNAVIRNLERRVKQLEALKSQRASKKKG